MTKVCTKCREDKPLEDFTKDIRHKDGKQSECKNCNNIRKKEYNKTKSGRFAQVKYRKTGKNKLAQVRYRKTEKGKLVHIKSECKRRSKISNAIDDFATNESRIVMFLQSYRCAWCGEYFDKVEPTLDHIVPVIKGGPLIIDNVQYLCRKHNSMKGIQKIDLRTDLHKHIIKTMG